MNPATFKTSADFQDYCGHIKDYLPAGWFIRRTCTVSGSITPPCITLEGSDMPAKSVSRKRKSCSLSSSALEESTQRINEKVQRDLNRSTGGFTKRLVKNYSGVVPLHFVNLSAPRTKRFGGCGVRLGVGYGPLLTSYTQWGARMTYTLREVNLSFPYMIFTRLLINISGILN